MPAGRGATEVPVDAEAEVVLAGRVATAVNPVNLANPVKQANLADDRTAAKEPCKCHRSPI